MPKRIIMTCRLLTTALFLLYAISAFSLTLEWETTIHEIKKTIPKNIKVEEFNPSSKKNYKNKLLEYIISLDASIKEKIVILRVYERPVVEYIFVKEMVRAQEKSGLESSRRHNAGVAGS